MVSRWRDVYKRQYEVWFVSGAHGEAELDAIAAAAPVAAQAAAAAQPE